MDKIIHPVKSSHSGVAKGEFNRVKKIALITAWILVVPVFLLSQVSFWQMPAPIAYAADSISDIEKEKDKIEDKLEKRQQELMQIQGAVYSTQSTINKTQSAINEVKATISRKEIEVMNLEDQIKLNEEMLRSFLQKIYYIKNQPILEIILEEKDFTDIFSSLDHLMTLEDKVVEISHKISETKKQIEKDKAELSDMKEQHEEVLERKIDEKQDLLVDKAEKEATIAELQQKLAELQSDLNVLTGKSFNAKDIKEAVEYASGKTGVPKGVLYGFLKMETNLGANTGQCTYEQVVKVSLTRYKKYGSQYKKSIALLYKRQNLFYDLVKSLGYSKSKKVSCSPTGYIGQGGAMGVPQFMSDTWQGYKSRITAKTGHSTPDPWDLTDGVMAMAIKLREAGATSDSRSAIIKASINYLGTSYENYYKGIIYWSKNYKRLFN